MSAALPFLPLAATAIGGLLGGDDKESQIQSETVPKFTSEQMKLFQSMMSRLNVGGFGRTPTTEETGYGNWLKKYPQWAESAVNKAFNPQYIKDMYSSSIIPEFEEKYLPQVKEAYAGPGYWGSARARGVSGAYENLARQEATDIGGVESQRQKSLMTLLAEQPQMEQTGAQWSRYLQSLGEDWTSPKWQAAMQMLGQDPNYTIAGRTQPQQGFMSQFLSGLGTYSGQNFLPSLSNSISSIFSGGSSGGGGASGSW